MEPFYIIERRTPAQAPLHRAPQPPARSWWTRAAPIDGRGNGKGAWVSGFTVAGLGREEEKSPVPLPLHVPPPASTGLRAPASRRLPAQPQLHSPGRPAEGAAPARRARARTPRASCCLDRRWGRGGQRGSGLRGLRGAPDRLRRVRCAWLPRAMPSARLSWARAVGSAGCSQFSTAGSSRLSSRLHLSRRAPPYNKPTGS